ncbi:MAG: hypothetical protein HY547_05675 [Elusimicrobia bacterium]|nr:hypothetical protein [Elusimicrobiota bacterium]
MENAKEIFDRISILARLGPYEERQHGRLAGDFTRILELFKVLSEAPDLSDAGSDHSAAPLREDVAKPSISVKALVENFPQSEGSLLKVPKVIE